MPSSPAPRRAEPTSLSPTALAGAESIYSMLRESAEALFAHYEVPLELGDSTDGDALEEASFVGVAGFASDHGLRGSVATGMASALLEATSPLPDADLADWCGELANQLVGRLKNRLLRREMTIAIGLPLVVQGSRLTLPVLNVRFTRQCTFRSAQGPVSLRLDLILPSDFALPDENAEADGPVSEGETLLFF